MSAAPITVNALLMASFQALRSYEFGNGSPELAKEVADAIEKYLVNNLRTSELLELRDAGAFERTEVLGSLPRGKEVADNRQS